MERKSVGFSRNAWGLMLGLGTLALIVVGCAGEEATPTPTTPTVAEYANPNLLVETSWLAQHLDDPALVVVDARKADAYEKGHIPGAVNLHKSLTFDPNPPVGKSMVGSVKQIEEVIGSKGISNDVRVVVYAKGVDTDAARLFWTLEYYGHTNVAFLNGGFTKWEKERRTTTTEVPVITPATFIAQANPQVLVAKDTILEDIDKEGVAILDARSSEEYQGLDVRATRGGHIPGAVNIDWHLNFTDDEAPVFKPAAELAQLYADQGVTKDKPVYAY